MTVIEQIEHEVRAIPSGKRREALRLIRGLKATAKGKRAGKKTLGAAREAIGAAKGMWRGRTDLPADPVAASVELRRRVMERSHGG